jgi:hypothetical protein
VTAALLAGGCRRDPAPQPAPPVAAPTETPNASAPIAAPAAGAPEAQTAGARFELGYETDAGGAIPLGLESRQFAAASKFMLAVRTDDLSAGTRLSVHWTDGAGTVLANEAREVAAGARFAAFASPDTAAWPTATYRVAVEIDGRPAGALEFRVEAASGAGS